MKKSVMSIALALLLACVPVKAETGMALVINGETAILMDAQGNPLDNVLVDGRLHVPIEALGRYLSLDIVADADNRSISLAGKPITLTFAGRPVEPAVIDGIVYVPVLALASMLTDSTVDIVGQQYHLQVKGAAEYKQGTAALLAGKYAMARDLFTRAGDYADAENRIQESWYLEAQVLLAGEQYDAASAAFEKAGDYADAANRVNEPYYVQGQKFQADGMVSEAAAAYAKAGQYRDAPALAEQMTAQVAEHLLASGDYKAAYAYYARTGREENIQRLFYHMAQDKRSAGETETALACYELAGDYQDASTQYSMLLYETAEALEADGKTDDAIAAYKAVGNYQDASEKWKKLTYDLARKKYNSEKFDEAYALYDTIRGYSDVDDRLKNSNGLKNAAKRVASAAVVNAVEVGDTFTYGSYVHVDSPNPNKQPIQWEVLKKDGRRIMVLSTYVLAKKPFHTSNTKYVEWSNCSLRDWLNGSFISNAFTENERKAIASVENGYENAKGQTAKSKEKVFLLSVGECNSHAQAAKEGKTKNGSDAYYWLRDRNYDWSYSIVPNVAIMGPYGYAYSAANGIDIYVRPAMWLNLESTAVDWSKYIKTTASASKYAVIERLIAAGKYDDALTKLSKEKTNAEVTRLIRECRYQMGIDALLDGKIITAREHFYPPSKAGYKHAEVLINIIDSIR